MNPTTTTAAIAPQLSAFVGTWFSHFGAFTIKADGSGTGSWRVYKWCSDDPTPPCDAQVNNNIVNGGNADIRITAVHGNTAFADVLHTTDAKSLPKGSVSITLVEPGDQLQVGGFTFCGPHAAPNACGA